MRLSTSDIIAIVAILVPVFLGGGWLTSYLAAKKQYKNCFLIPLQTILELNKKIHNELTRDINIKQLEYAPDYVQQEFNKLPVSSPTKKLWISRIETLISNNEMAINLITSNSGLIRSKMLKYNLENFVHHAQKFNDIWKLIPSNKQIAPGINPDIDLLGETYPQQLDKLLQEEIDKY